MQTENFLQFPKKDVIAEYDSNNVFFKSSMTNLAQTNLYNLQSHLFRIKAIGTVWNARERFLLTCAVHSPRPPPPLSQVKIWPP